MIRYRLFVLAFCVAIATHAQDWHSPYNQPDDGNQPDKNSVGYMLEPIFDGVLAQCNQGDFKHLQHRFLGFLWNVDDPPKSSIPIEFQNSPGISLSEDTLFTFKHQSIGQVFAYIFIESEKNNLASVTFDHSRMLKLDQTLAPQDPSFNVIRAPIALIANPSSTFVNTTSCDSILSAAANEKSGISLPAITIQQSFAGAFQTSSKFTLSLVRAENFNSPLADMLDNDVWVNYAHLLLWDLYNTTANRTAGLSSANTYYISEAPAIALGQTSKQSTTSSVDLRLGVTATLPYLKVDGSFQDSLASSSDTAFSSADTVILTGFDTNAFMKSAPDAEAVVTQISDNSRLAIDKHTGILIPGNNLIGMTASGVPRSLCSKNLWDARLINPNVAAASISVADAVSVPAAVSTDPPACDYNLNLAIPNGLNPAATPSFKSDVEIFFTQKLKGRDNAMHELKFQGNTQDLSLSGSPTVDTRAPFNPFFAAVTINGPAGVEHDLTWTRQLLIGDTPADAIVIPNGVTVTNVSMRCSSGAINQFQVSAGLVSTDNPHSVTLTGERKIFGNTSLDIIPNSTNVESCTILASIGVHMSQGRTFTTELQDWVVNGPTSPPLANPVPPVAK